MALDFTKEGKWFLNKIEGIAREKNQRIPKRSISGKLVVVNDRGPQCKVPVVIYKG